MEGLRRILKLRPKDNFQHHTPQHHQIKDNWGKERDPLREGIKFYVDYLGSTLVDELDEGQSYGNKISAKAVKTIFDMAKGLGRKCPKVEVMVSVDGIVVTNMETDVVLINLSIYRINFCTADRHHDHVFAFIARSTENENMECHAFACSKKKVAQAVTLTVAQSFQLAKEDYEMAEKEQERKKLEEDFHLDNDKEEIENIPNVQNTSADIQGFEDNFSDVQITDRSPSECIQSLKPTNPFRTSSFDLGVEVEELNKSLLQWLEEKEREKSGHVTTSTTNNNHSNLISF